MTNKIEASKLEGVSQEEVQIMQEIDAEPEPIDFESDSEELAEFNAAVLGMNTETRTLYSQVQSEAAQTDVEMVIAMQEGLADRIRKYFRRIFGHLKEKLKGYARRGRNALCNYLKQVICGNLSIFRGKIICNIGLPRVCKWMFGWILRKLGLSSSEALSSSEGIYEPC